MKSIETKFQEAFEALTKADRTKEFKKKVTPQHTIEAKLHIAESILKDVGVVRAVEVRKHNGAGDNGTLITESANNFSEGYTQTSVKPFAKLDRMLADDSLKRGEITEAEHRKLCGVPPAEFDKLNESQKKEFNLARLIGFNESDCLKLAHING